MKLLNHRLPIGRRGQAVRFTIFAAILGLASAGLAAQADLSRLVVIGDSLMAGYQNGSLCGPQQAHGIASLIAQQAGVDLPLPLIAEPGIPNALQLSDPGPPPVITRAPGASTGRVDPLAQPWNLAVPGQTVLDAVTLRPDLKMDSLTDLILGLPGLLGGVSRSQVEWAEALQPTTILVWVGPNDTLGAALQADASFVTPEPVFAAAYEELAHRLAATGATLVFANLPDVTVIPYLTSAEDVAAKLGVPLASLGAALGLSRGDFVTPDALGYIQAILTGSVSGPLPDNVVLTAAEVSTIQAATRSFNQIIAEEAQANHAALVDMNGFLNSLKQRGVVVHGQRLGTGFLGGIFSLDGIHPTNTGAAVTANEFIQALNSRFGAGIPRVNVVHVAEKDPLVLPGVGHPASALTQVDKAATQNLKALVSR